MGIKFHCPNGHKMNVKAFLAGKRGKCPKCGASVRIPQESTTPAAKDDQDSGEDLLAAALGTQPSPSPSVTTTAPAVPTPSRAPAPTPAAVVTAVRPVTRPAFAPAIPTVPTVAPSYVPQSPAVVRVPVPGGAAFASDPISEAPSAIWYVRPPSGGQYGPARGDVMRKWLADGRVSGDSIVWREGFRDWKNASEIFPSLMAAAPVAPPPPPPPSEPSTPTAPKSSRIQSRYEARRSQGNGMAIVVLVLLAVICVALVIGLVVVVMNTVPNNGEVEKNASLSTPQFSAYQKDFQHA